MGITSKVTHRLDLLLILLSRLQKPKVGTDLSASDSPPYLLQFSNLTFQIFHLLLYNGPARVALLHLLRIAKTSQLGGELLVPLPKGFEFFG